MASIHRRKRTDGSIAYQVRWRVDGKARTKIALDHDAARKIKAQVELRGDFIGDPADITGIPTVTQQAEVFLGEHTRGNAATIREYRRIIAQHITPTLGGFPVTSLTVPILTAWGRGLQMSDKTRANVTAVLSGILESAVPDWLPANPWRKVRLPKTDGPRDHHFLTAEDFALILAEIPEHYRLLVTVFATTGIRWGEAAALNVGDLDLTGAAPVLRITKAMKHRARQTDAPGVPKTDKAVRWVTVPPELADNLRALTTRPKTEPLFPTLKGKRIRNSTFHTLVWQPALDRAQANGLAFRPRIHDLRAAATTWLLEAGMRPDEVADLMGHESIDTTLRIYRRANPQAGRKAAAAMSSLLGRVVAPQIES